MAQGEYIAPEKIENVYIRSEFVSQCFVHGDGLKVYAQIYICSFLIQFFNFKSEHSTKVKQKLNVLYPWCKFPPVYNCLRSAIINLCHLQVYVWKHLHTLRNLTAK